MDRHIGAQARDHGVVIVAGNAIGQVHGTQRRHHRDPFDVGVLTVLTEEMRAVLQRLRRYPDLRPVPLAGGADAYVVTVPAHGGELRVAVLQTLEPGSRSAIEAYHRLRDEFQPRVVLLVGIAGGIREDVAIGDVVIGDQVVYYDARRETEQGPRRRGQSQPMTPFVKERLNAYFLRYDNSVPVPGGAMRVHRGPIGSGDAVITHRESGITSWLRGYHEKTLAVETEAAAVGHAFYEDVDADQNLLGWLTIRGISDRADRHDWEERRSFASDRAALVMDLLLPLLKPAAERSSP